jgi:hypothetical protein
LSQRTRSLDHCASDGCTHLKPHGHSSIIFSADGDEIQLVISGERTLKAALVMIAPRDVFATAINSPSNAPTTDMTPAKQR